METLSRWGRSARALAQLGFAASMMIAGSSYWVGAVPIYFRANRTPVVSLMRVGAYPARLVFYVGLAALCSAWLLIGRLVLERSAEDLDWRRLRRIGLAWALPLIFAIPLGSRDLWAYAAQGQLVRHHLDPYTLGPSALPGAFASEVSHRWVGSPAPYGPLWLLIGRLIAASIGTHVGLTVAMLRLLSVAGLGLLAVSVPMLARRAGGRPDVAIWLLIANPLTLVLGVGGGHNDLLMVGLMTSGLVLVAAPRGILVGCALLAAASAVKSPAVVAAMFAVPLWLSSDARRTGATRTIVAGVATFVATFAAITAASGLGFGWIRQVNSSASVVSWMSLPSFAAIIWDLTTGHARPLKLDTQMTDFRTVGTVLSIAGLGMLWLLALRRPAPASLRRGRFDAWQLLALALLSIVVLGPSVQPWYFLWPLAVAAATPLPARLVTVIAGLSIGMVLMIRPNGVGLQMNPSVVLLLGVPVLIASVVLSRGSRSAVVENPVGAGDSLMRFVRRDRARTDEHRDQHSERGGQGRA